MSNWLTLKQEQQVDMLNKAGAETGLPPFAIEKDAWVTLVLRMLFSAEIREFIVFKGGTSLSKVYNLIKRFSEDIDLAIDRTYFGFDGEISKGDIRRLRRKSHDFSLNKLPDILKAQFDEYNIDSKLYEIDVPNTKVSDQDPEVVHVNYSSVFTEESYLPNRVQIEVGARSLNEPSDNKEITSLIDSIFPESSFVEKSFNVRSIIPQKTLLEKIILLHEEFQKTEEKIKSLRMSRHLFDIYKISKTEFGRSALKDEQLFRKICNHRKVFTPIRGIDYDNLSLKELEFIPSGEFSDKYKSDYQDMRKNMIYGESPEFDILIDHLKNIIE